MKVSNLPLLAAWLPPAGALTGFCTGRYYTLVWKESFCSPCRVWYKRQSPSDATWNIMQFLDVALL